MTDVDPPAAASLGKRALAGASWTLVGYVAQQVLRLGSNLILARLLLPEAFGLASLAFIFITGLEMLSDVGLGPAIIQSTRGDDRKLLDTAWTVQVIRGFAMFAVSLLIAYPAARFYHQPMLTLLVAMAGVGVAIRGFTPTRVHALNRQLVLGRVTLMELGCQILGSTATIIAAAVYQSAWALIVGALLADVARVVLSSWMLPGERNHWLLDRQGMNEIVKVGRWIFLSTAVTFAAGHLDRLTIGRLLSVREVGVYTIAFQFVFALTALGRTVGGRVLFPALAETTRTTPELMYSRLRNARVLWVAPTCAALVVLAVFGDVLIRLLYATEFQDAGWMLRVLAAGAIAGVLNQSSGVLWPALGEFRIILLLMLVQVPLLVASMVVGYTLRGVEGCIVGCAAIELLMYPLSAALVASRKLWQPEIDVSALLVCGAITGLGFYLR